MFGPGWESAAQRLVKRGRLRERGGRYLPRGPGYPASEIALRSASPNAVAIAESERGELIGTVEYARAHSVVHPGAVYLHMGASYEVEDSTWPPDARSSALEATGTPAQTESRDLDRVGREQRDACGVILSRGIVSVTEQGWPTRRRVADHSVLTCWPRDAQQQFVTQALWYEFPTSCWGGVPARRAPGLAARGRHGQSRASADSDVRPLGHRRPLHRVHRQTGRATIFIYAGNRAEWGSRVWATSASKRWWTTPCG